jgi:hypothetical protein
MRFAQLVFAALACPFIVSLAQAKDSASPVPPALYIQQGFNAEPAAREFADWQSRFQGDWDAAFTLAQKNGKESLIEQAPELFPNSIGSGKKSLSLKKYLVDAIYSGAGGAVDAGIIAKRMMLKREAQPVGYGGIYEQDGYDVEIWYMAWHDLTTMSHEDFKAAAAYAAFEKLQLPKLNEGTRGTWPVLLFVRNPHKHLMLYGHSKEMFDITEKAEWRQYR